MRYRRLLSAVIVIGGCSAAAADWPQFRGPTGQGTAPQLQLPDQWSATENIAWKTQIPGEGWSSPVLVGQRIYLTTAVPQGNDHLLRVVAVEADSGKLLWNTEVFRQEGNEAPSIHSKNSHASPTPVVDGRRIYAHFGHQGIACLDLSGKVLWRNTDHRYHPVHGNGGSPALVGRTVVFSVDGRDEAMVIAVDRETGKTLWKTERGSTADKKFSFSTPLVINVGGHQQIISPGSNIVCALDARTGKEIWRVRYDGYSVIPRPVFGHGKIYISTGYNTPQVLAIRVDGRGDVTDTHVEWQLERGAPHTPSLLLVGDELYMVSDRGVATCVDAHTGQVHWQERLGGNYSASPVYAGGLIYFQSEEGDATVIRAGTDFQLVANNSVGERTLASYALGDQAIFVRSAEHLFRIEEDDKVTR